jgi:hypothetical protein
MYKSLAGRNHHVDEKLEVGAWRARILPGTILTRRTSLLELHIADTGVKQLKLRGQAAMQMLRSISAPMLLCRRSISASSSATTASCSACDTTAADRGTLAKIALCTLRWCVLASDADDYTSSAIVTLSTRRGERCHA